MGKQFGIRSWQMALATVAALPVLLFAGVAAHRLAEAERQATLTELEHRTESAASKVERYLQSLRELAVTLATSPTVLAGDMQAFYEFGKRALAAGNIGRNVVLVAPDGRQLLSTLRPFGEKLPPAGDVAGVSETLARKTPHISNLFQGSVTSSKVFTVWAPVIRDGQVVSLVGVTVEPQDLTAVLREEKLRDGWVGVVVDRNETIVARTFAPETQVGQSAVPEATAAHMAASRGAYSLINKEGLPVSAYFIKLPATGWTVAIGVPKRQLEAAAGQSLRFMLGLGFAALSTAGLLAFLVGRHMSAQVANVARAAVAVGNGDEPAIGTSSVRELDEVSGALKVARHLIDAREIALRESEARLRSILETANVIAWEVDVVTDRVHAVGPAARLFGRPEGFRMEDRAAFASGIAAVDRDRVMTEFDQAVRAGRHYSSEFRVPLANGETRWIGAEAAADYDTDGKPVGMRGISFDVSKRKIAELALADAIRVTAIACEAGHMGTWHRDVASNRLTFSDELLDLIGIDRSKWGGTSESLEAYLHPEDIARRRQERAKAEAAGKVIDLDFRIRRPDGQIRWMQSRGRMDRGPDGSPIESFGVMIDITDRKKAEAHQEMLIAELDHRVKNVLAQVIAVAQRTRETSGSRDDFMAAFDGRIRAMALTHSLLSASHWQGASLTTLVQQELEPYATPSNTELVGPDISLAAGAAQTVATVVHELATNAGKYGALSSPTGRVCVHWHQRRPPDAPPSLVIEWVESGGPRIETPKRRGFGSSVILDQIPFELEGKVDLNFAPGGVTCRIEIPLSHVADRPGS